VPPTTDTIGNWSSTQLFQVLRSYLAVNLPDHFPALTVDSLIVTDSLNVQGSSTFNRALVTVGAGTGPPFTNSWANLGSGNAPAAYWKDDQGLVFMEGTMSSGTLGQSAFTLPPGFRPDKSRTFPAYSNSVAGLVSVTSAGLVIPLAVSTASNASYTLDGIVFRTGKT
jgi:hypothetical protein